MAFKFKRKERVEKGVRRLSCERVEKALERLRQCENTEAIHGVRKEIKKLRAVLRLVQSEIGKKQYEKTAARLQKAAHLLEPARDAQVRVKALEGLSARFKGEIAAHAFGSLHKNLREECRRETNRFKKERCVSTVGQIFRKLPSRIENLEVKRKGWSAIGPGIKTSYARGRKAYKVVGKEPTAENFHEWRKRVKDLWYHIQLLTPIWPEQMAAMAGELETLGEQLGDDHDLVMLKETAEKDLDGEAELKARETLVGLLELRNRELRSAALLLGKRFYEEKPSLFCKRLETYWKTWRSESSQTQGEHPESLQ
jgi:CHAD domain-containing protein